MMICLRSSTATVAMDGLWCVPHCGPITWYNTYCPVARDFNNYGNVNHPCPRATPSDSGWFTAKNPRQRKQYLLHNSSQAIENHTDSGIMCWYTFSYLGLPLVHVHMHINHTCCGYTIHLHVGNKNRFCDCIQMYMYCLQAY